MANAAPERDSTEQFLRTLWPDAGFRCLTSVTPGVKGMRHHWVADATVAASTARTLSQNGDDAYFGLSVFSEAQRRAACVEAVKSFWADLDVGPTKGYATVEEALTALLDWCAKTGVPVPTYIVLSGSGLHVYWALMNAISILRWQALADRMKALMLATGLKIDPTRTADSASVLRVPGTMNYKGDPAPVSILQDTGTLFTVEEIEARLPMTGPRPVSGDAPASAWTAGMEREFPPAKIEPIVAQCRQMAAAYQTKCDNMEEPLWRAVLSVLWRCEGGEALVHEWSKGDDRYSYDETQSKAEATKGPQSCEQFAVCNPTACAECPLNGKITSPILIGTELPEPEVRPDDEAPDERLNAVDDFRVSAAGVYITMLNDETGVEERKRITSCPIWVLENRERARAEDEPDMSSLMLQWHSLDGRSRKATILQHEVHEPRAFTKWLSDQNLISMVDNLKMLQMYLTRYTRELIRQGRVQTYYDRLGWFGDDFVMAGQKVTREGLTPARVQSTTVVERLSVPKGGDINRWVKAVSVLDRPGLEFHRYALLAGFASPLLEIAGWQSAVLALSGTTGTGKTTGAMLATSLYGDPTLLVVSSTSTENATFVQMGALSSVPMFVDEISRWHPDRICNFGYAGPNGEGKAALNQNRTMQRAPRWTMVPIVTTNRPLSDYPEKDIDEPIKRRVLELHFDRNHMLTTAEAEVLHRAMKRDYALPGLCYMALVVRTRPQIAEMLRAAEAFILANTSLDGADRFPRWQMAGALVGGVLAKQAGLISFDVPATVLAAAREAESASLAVENEEARLVSLVSDYVVHNRHRVVWWETGDRSRDSLSFPSQDAEREPVARYCKDTKDLAVQSSELKKFLLEHRLSLTNLKDWLAAHGVRHKKSQIAPGVPAAWCYVFPTEQMGLNMEGADGAQD